MVERLGSKLHEARSRRRPAGGPKLSGRARKLIIALTNAVARDPGTIVVAVWDRDGNVDYQRDRDQIIEALRSSGPRGVAVGLCIEEVEAWLLADPGAFRSCFRRGPRRSFQHPESLADPKQVLGQLIEECAGRKPEPSELPQLYCRLAEQIDLHRLSEACPLGFEHFRAALGELVAPALEEWM